MKKAGIFTLTLILIMAMFSGCRGQSTDTTTSTDTGTGTTASTAKPTQATTRATLPPPVITEPSTSTASKPMAPSGTDATGGTEMPRMYPGPRY